MWRSRLRRPQHSRCVKGQRPNGVRPDRSHALSPPPPSLHGTGFGVSRAGSTWSFKVSLGPIACVLAGVASTADRPTAC
jgi:hypothetical protein